MTLPPIRFISALGLVAFGGVAGGTAAEEKPSPPPASPPAAEQGIAGARRDFDTVKAARDPASQPKGAVPRVGVPEMHTESPSGPRKQQKSQTGALEKKSSNWLVDAMEKSDPRRKAASENGAREKSQDSTRGKEAEGIDLLAGQQTEERSARDEKIAADERERKEERTVVNPLNQYLDSWMTPKDYALLKPGLEAAAKPSDAGVVGLAAPGAPPAQLGVGDPGMRAAVAAAPAGPAQTPRENPYLQAMAPPPPPANPAPVFTPPPSMAAAPRPPQGVLAPLPPPAPVQTGKPQMPDFARPAADDKYFKPLKRF